MPTNKRTQVPRSQRAAQWLHIAQYEWDTGKLRSSRFKQRPSFTDASKAFGGIGRTQIHKQYKKLLANNGLVSPSLPTGRPPSLTDAEEAALAIYIRDLEESGFPGGREQIEHEANRLRAMRSPPCGPVCRHWWQRWKARHQEFRVTTAKPVEAAPANDVMDDIHRDLQARIALGVSLQRDPAPQLRRFLGDDPYIFQGLLPLHEEQEEHGAAEDP